MIKKFKELGHSASLIQKLILIGAILVYNWFGLILYEVTNWYYLGDVWLITVFPISVYLIYHLFPKKD
jgi:hypothetical protein